MTNTYKLLTEKILSLQPQVSELSFSDKCMGDDNLNFPTFYPILFFYSIPQNKRP